MNTPKKLTYLNSVLVGSNPSDITDVNGVIYFTADDGRSGRELWKLEANGTPPIRVNEINLGLHLLILRISQLLTVHFILLLTMVNKVENYGR
ncbi:MAG: hypothetical protein HC917_01095 [Richelia sp. SM2_1_7]|nr:hypothetical protein [Richelia sp. SM2_1_7]